MGFIAIIFLIVVLLAFFSGDGVSEDYQKNNSFFYDFKERSGNENSLSKNDDYHFEEAESFIDSDGNEHIVNEDFYCEECDDFHDDY